MKEYEINKETLAIIAIEEDKSMVYEKENEFIVYCSSLKIIDDSCKFFGSSYKGRVEGTKKMIKMSHKAPIIIEESNNIIFFPTMSPRLEECSWISLNNIETFIKNGKNTIIEFSCGKKIELNISFLIIDNQILRAARLESILNKRKKLKNFN